MPYIKIILNLATIAAAIQRILVAAIAVYFLLRGLRSPQYGKLSYVKT
mgnify:CR=1 FL=1